mgnify:CR=1
MHGFVRAEVALRQVGVARRGVLGPDVVLQVGALLGPVGAQLALRPLNQVGVGVLEENVLLEVAFGFRFVVAVFTLLPLDLVGGQVHDLVLLQSASKAAFEVARGALVPDGVITVVEASVDTEVAGPFCFEGTMFAFYPHDGVGGGVAGVHVDEEVLFAGAGVRAFGAAVAFGSLRNGGLQAPLFGFFALV